MAPSCIRRTKGRSRLAATAPSKCRNASSTCACGAKRLRSSQWAHRACAYTLPGSCCRASRYRPVGSMAGSWMSFQRMASAQPRWARRSAARGPGRLWGGADKAFTSTGFSGAVNCAKLRSGPGRARRNQCMVQSSCACLTAAGASGAAASRPSWAKGSAGSLSVHSLATAMPSPTRRTSSAAACWRCCCTHQDAPKATSKAAPTAAFNAQRCVGERFSRATAASVAATASPRGSSSVTASR